MRNAHLMDKPHMVYLMFDDAGGLLYVGCTSNIKNRLRQHGRFSDWYPRISRVSAREYPGMERGLAIEARVIRRFAPEINVLSQRDEKKRMGTGSQGGSPWLTREGRAMKRGERINWRGDDKADRACREFLETLSKERDDG